MRKLLILCIVLLLTACTSAEREMDIIQQVERDLEKIVTSSEVNKLSSNPNYYIKAHKNEFSNIVEQKQIALKHFLNKFAKSNEDGLEEYIMASACSEILGEKNPVNEWSTGKEWYEQYIEAIEE
ncbi:hypothetical protein M3172_12660 [Mesobacillus subterraneus]|uniref:hypothetical protein n=1 Tax=Mesobacillus subterraneus TaxID=285983 RepID=UPI00203C217C|nr:hypothetical protein [Mesobacillus subterraneus]MCM3574042.1 hypothetical protein [Mesobacillus subterraneus]